MHVMSTTGIATDTPTATTTRYEMAPQAAASGRSKPARKRRRRRQQQSYSPSSSDSSDSSDNDEVEVVTDPPAQAQAGPSKASQVHGKARASSSVSSDSSDSDDSDDTTSSGSDSDDDSSEDDDSTDSDSSASSSSATSTRPQSVTTAATTAMDIDPPVSINKWQRNRRTSMSPSASPPPREIPSFFASKSTEDEDERRLKFRRVYMDKLVEGFSDDLESLRASDPSLKGQKLQRLIDSLAYGIDVFNDPSSKESAVNGKAGPRAGLDEVGLILNEG